MASDKVNSIIESIEGLNVLELVELKNQSDSLAYQSEKTLSDLGDKVESVLKERAETLIKDLREATGADVVATIGSSR